MDFFRIIPFVFSFTVYSTLTLGQTKVEKDLCKEIISYIGTDTLWKEYLSPIHYPTSKSGISFDIQKKESYPILLVLESEDHVSDNLKILITTDSISDLNEKLLLTFRNGKKYYSDLPQKWKAGKIITPKKMDKNSSHLKLFFTSIPNSSILSVRIFLKNGSNYKYSSNHRGLGYRGASIQYLFFLDEKWERILAVYADILSHD